MVSDRGDKTHLVYKLTYVVDAITESPVCYISIWSVLDYELSSLSFRSGIVEGNEQESGREHRLPWNVTELYASGSTRAAVLVYIKVKKLPKTEA